MSSLLKFISVFFFCDVLLKQRAICRNFTTINIFTVKKTHPCSVIIIIANCYYSLSERACNPNFVQHLMYIEDPTIDNEQPY
jgi:hypothetical protein